MIRTAIMMEYALIASLALILIFQVIVPVLKGTPLFPFLRPRRGAAISKLAEAVEEREIHDIEEAAAAAAPPTGSSSSNDRKDA